MAVRWRATFAMMIVALATVRAGSDPAPGVVAFSPSGSVERVEQIKVRFATPMVAFGDPRLPSPVTGTCSAGASGRWVDASSYAIDLPAPLAGGQRCSYALTPGLKDARGAAMSGPTRFAFDTGGPNLRAAIPDDGGSRIEEDQVFLLALNAAATPASVAANAACIIDGVGEAVPLDILPAATRDEIVTKAQQDYRLSRFLITAGATRPEAGSDEEVQPRAEIVAARCRRALPSGGRVALVWGAGIATADGLKTLRPRRFDYGVRPAFTARFECSRSTPASACSPLEAMTVSFTGQVPAGLAKGVRLVDASGKDVAAEPVKANVQMVDSVTFKGPFPERAKFRVVMPAALADDAGRALTNAARFPLDVATDDAPPLVKFAASFGIIEAAEGGVLPVTLRAVEARLGGNDAPVGGRDVSVATDAEVADWLRQLDDAEDRTQDEEPIAGTDQTKSVETTRNTPLVEASTPARRFSIARKDARAFEVVGIPLTAKGFHVVELASPKLGAALLGRGGTRYVAAGALVTDMAVHFQWGRGRSLVWVTRLADATPIAGAKIAVSDSCSGAALAVGTTDAKGRLTIGDLLPEPSSYGSCKYGPSPLMVSARKDGDFSFTLTTWSKGIAPGDFSLDSGYGFDRTAWHTVFDRTLFRAGETVAMKHIVRARTDSGFGPAELPRDPTIVIRHLGSDQTYELDAPLGRDGIGTGAWAIPKDAALGEYAVEIGERGATERHRSGSFTVEEFRLPTIRARVDGPRKPQVAPTRVDLDLSLAYLSGGAAGKAPVKLRTLVQPREIVLADYPRFSFTGEAIVPGIVRLDGSETPAAATPTRARVEPVTLGANGTARVAVDKLVPVTVPSTLVAEMDYDDANGEVATAKGTVDLDPASVRVGIAKDGWIAKADDVRLNLVALDLANKPVRGQKISVTLFSRETYSYRKRLIGGFYAYDNSQETKQLGTTCSGTTDDKGLFKCTLDVGVSGEVIALATATDASGHVSRATQSLWLAGDDDWWFGGDNGDRMDVIPEAPEYPAGGVARLQVRMPFRSATALVSVLRDGVIDSFVTELSGKDPVVEVALKRGYAPDIYVSVLAVRGRVAGWRLWLADLARAWDLPWLSRDAASPTSLVDLAKPSYRFGLAKLRVGWDDHRLGVKVATDAPSYAVRKVAQTTVQVTPPKGRALPAGTEIAFAAVDEALLQLRGNDSWDVLTAMMADRPLAVLTSTAQSQVVGKRHYGRKAVAAGGGGGEDAGTGTVRRDFNPLLLWRGRIPLDSAGRATIPVTMNDSLSAFRLVAIATGGTDLFGTGSVVVRTTQDLQLLAGVPPLVREGDRYTATVLVRNATGKPFRATVGGHAGTALLPDRIVDVPAGNATTVAWTVAAPAQPGPIVWAIDAAAATGAKDAVRVTQSVIPAVPVTVLQATLVQIDRPQTFPVALPADALPGRGGIDVALSRSLGGGLPGVRAYMAAYPYGCIEQLLSVAVATNDRAQWDRVAASLPAYLDRDGLVRFFPADWIAGDDSLTAYILRLSVDSGWALPDDTRAKMIAGLTGFVGGKVSRPHDNMLVIEKGRGIVGETSFGGDRPSRVLGAVAALLSVGAATPAMVEPLSIAPDAWPTATLIDWVTVLRLPGIPDAPGKLQQALQVLRARLDLQGTRLTINRADDPWQLLSSPDLTAARLLLAVAPLPDWKADVGRIARGLMLGQSRGHWDSTPANAVGTLAMRDFARRFERAAVTGTTAATVGATRTAFVWPNPTPATLAWSPAKTDLTLSHSGTGSPWAIVTARAAVPLKAPFASGFALRRTVSAVTQAVPGRWSRGDVMKVRVEVTPRAPVQWVVINDPVPAGATILGGSLGGRSEILAAGATAGTQPTFVERRTDAVHAHYELMPKAPVAYEYTVRLNSEGQFRLPPTRVEALYSPEMMTMVPNAGVEVAARP